MSEEMCYYFEDSIKPLITEWIGLREKNLTENEINIKLDETYKAVNDYVLRIKNGCFVNQFVTLVNRMIKETDLLENAINEKVSEHDLERLITSAHFAYQSLTRFCTHYSEDMKPFKPLLKRNETNLLSVLKELAKLKRLNVTTIQLINDITFKIKSYPLYSGSNKPIMNTTLVTASSALAFFDFDIALVGIIALTTYKILNAYLEPEASFTQRDLNDIGLRAAAKSLQKLRDVLTEKQWYEEDFGKHGRICSKTSRLVDDELGKLFDLILFGCIVKLKNKAF